MPRNLLRPFSILHLFPLQPLLSCFQHKNTDPAHDINCSMARLPELPSEVLCIIGSWCSALQSERNKTLFNLCLVSRSFAAVFTPCLYRELQLRQLTKRSSEKLLRTLTNTPLLGTHIRALDTTGNVPHVREEVTMEALGHVQGWISAYYSRGGAIVAERAFFHELISPEASFTSLLLVLAPNLTRLEYQSHRDGLAFFVLVEGLRIKNGLERRGDRHPLSLIEHLEIFKHRTTDIVRGELDRVMSAVITVRLRTLSLDGIRLVRSRKALPELSPTATLESLPAGALPLPSTTRLQSLKLWGSTIDMDILGEIIRNSPQLEDLTILDPVLDTCVSLPHTELLSKQHIMSLGALGDTLRQNRQCHRSLRSLRIHYHVPDFASGGVSSWGHSGEAIGSLAPLTSLEVLNIDTNLLMGLSERRDGCLADYLPTSLRFLKCFPTSDLVAEYVVRQLFELMQDARFDKLVFVYITMNMDGSRAARRSFTQYCAGIETVPRGWVNLGASGDIDDDTVISTGTGHAAGWALKSYALERMRVRQNLQPSQPDLVEQ